MDKKEANLKENKRLSDLKISDQNKRWDKDKLNSTNRDFMDAAEK